MVVSPQDKVNRFLDDLPDDLARLGDGRWVWTVGSTDLEMSRDFADIVFGNTERSVPVSNFRRRMFCEGRDAFDEAAIDAIDRNRAAQFEHQINLSSGETRWFRTTMVAVTHRRTGKIALFAVSRDIENDVNRINAAEAARHASEEASRQKTDFLATISHELRTPLNGVLGMAQLMGRSNLDDQQSRYLSRLMASGNALLSIIDDVLDLTRIEAGEIKLDDSALNITEMLRDVQAAAIGLAAAKDLELRVSVEPSAVMHDGFYGDEKRIKQVALNLVGNAVKFTDQGSVTLSANVVGDEIEIGITDTGPGIAEDQQALIFERFRQADGSATRAHGGTGLGLSISSDLITSMGGTIGVESTLGEGSKFFFRLPLQNQANSAAAPVAAPVQSATQEHGKLVRVLMAEDNPVNRELIEEILLLDDSCTLTSVENGREAVDILSKQTFDLILMDINMPVMSGDDAIRAIRNGEGGQSHIPIIALTANALEHQKQAYLEAGATAYLPKPVDADALLDLVASLPATPNAAA